MISLHRASFFSFPAWAAALFLAGCAAIGAVQAQDRLIFRDGHVENGKVVGVRNGAVFINIGTQQLNYSEAAIARAEVAEPASFQAGYAAYQAGQWDRALAALKPIVDQFKGLPVEWASEALAALGDIYIEKNDLPKAVAAFTDFRTLYPSSQGTALRLNVASARIAFAQNNLPAAEKQLVPIRDAALKRPADATRQEGAAYGQACFLLGQIEEHQQSYQSALVDYLRAVTLFYEDGAIAARAEKSADALRAAHPGVSVP